MIPNRHSGPGRRAWLLVYSLVVVTCAASAFGGGVAVEGSDRSRILPPAGVELSPYRNAGYQLSVGDGEARVDVDTAPLRSQARFRPLTSPPAGPIERLARSLTADAETEYTAVSRILGWLARNVSYNLDRSESQAALDVLERRSGYCTGVARLAVAMVEAAGLPAREVAGWVAADGQPGAPDGFHRWIEVRFADVGWVFSDPLSSHHYVPATYVRLASEMVRPDEGTSGLLLERSDAQGVVDLYPDAAVGVTARRNDDRQLAASLRVRVLDAPSGTAVLDGGSRRRIHTLDDGDVTFVGLDPGRYILRLLLPGRPAVERSVNLPDRVRTALFLRGDAVSGRPRAVPQNQEGLR